MGVWLTEKGVHSTHTGTHCTEPKEFFFSPKKGEICFLVFGYCTWGPSSWKRASISQMAELMWAVDFPRRVFFFITWPGFSACRRCGMWKTVCPTMCSWLGKKTKTRNQSNPKLIKAQFALTVIIYIVWKRSPSEDETGLCKHWLTRLTATLSAAVSVNNDLFTDSSQAERRPLRSDPVQTQSSIYHCSPHRHH